MDSIKTEKFQAMNKYRRSRSRYYKYLNLHHLLAGLACSLVFNHICSFWFPFCPCSSMKHFLLTSLPCIWSSFSNPKCLFVVVNVIVIFLFGESRSVNLSPSPARDVYSEYIERSRSLRRRQEIMKIRQQEKKKEEEEEEEVVDIKLMAEDKEVKEEAQGKEILKLAEKEEDKLEVEIKEVITAEAKEIEVKQVDDRALQQTSVIMEEEEEERDDGEEEGGLLPTEELNKRVEEFIARVNKQRWLEAQSLVCCNA